jgi:hypothetical protein
VDRRRRAGEGREKRQVGRYDNCRKSSVEYGEDSFCNGFAVAQDAARPETQDAEPTLAHESVPARIMLRGEMMAAINLYHQSQPSLGKIGKVGSDGKLPDKLVPGEMMGFQQVPHCPFRRIIAFAQLAGTGDG